MVVANLGTKIGRGLGYLLGATCMGWPRSHPPPWQGIQDGKLWVCHPATPWIFSLFSGAPQALQTLLDPETAGGDPMFEEEEKLLPFPHSPQYLGALLASLAWHPLVLPTQRAGPSRTCRSRAACPTPRTTHSVA